MAQSKRKTQSRRSCKSFESVSPKWKSGSSGGKRLKRSLIKFGWTAARNCSLHLMLKPGKLCKNFPRNTFRSLGQVIRTAGLDETAQLSTKTTHNFSNGKCGSRFCEGYASHNLAQKNFRHRSTVGQPIETRGQVIEGMANQGGHVMDAFGSSSTKHFVTSCQLQRLRHS